MGDNIEGNWERERLVWGPKGKAFSKILNFGDLGLVVLLSSAEHNFRLPVLILGTLGEQTVQR